MRRGAKPAKAKGEAKPPGVRKSRKDEGSRLGDLEKRLAETLGQLQTRDRQLAEAQEQLTAAHAQVIESLAQQTATSEILRVISQAQTDVQPVFDAIVRSAARLCHASNAAVFRTDGRTIEHPAAYGAPPDAYAEVVRQYYPMPLTRWTQQGQAMLERSVVYLEDSEAPSTPPLLREAARRLGFRSQVTAPMLCDGQPVGAITVTRAEPGRFTDGEVALLQTFAEQAVIAIENVRLFKETKEALERQTATSEILRVISSSPTDIQPVFDTLAESAARLCDAVDAVIARVDGDRLWFVAHHGPIPSGLVGAARPFTRGSVAGRAVLEGRIVHVADLQAEADEFPEGFEIARRLGHRTTLSVPLMRGGVALGVITLRRTENRPFAERQIALLQTFADQAVIAIENVRLFNETKEALERQTATSEILRVISSSPTDVQPVLDAVAESAARLCAAYDAVIDRLDGDVLRLVAHYGPIPARPPTLALPVVRSSLPGRSVLDRQAIQVADLQAETEEFLEGALAREYGFHTVLSVPLLREGVAIGTIGLRRTEVQPFTETQIALLQTFADQAVIAIENVRLFKELEARNKDLTEALERETATSEILRVISSSPTDVQRVFDAVAESAARLCQAYDASIFCVDADRLLLAAHHGPIHARTIGEFTLSLDRGTIGGRTVLDARTVHIADVQAEAAEFLEASENARRLGFRTLLSVPLMREGVAIGVIQLFCTEVRPFTERQVELLKTFADQAVIAIENVRLFTELQEKNRALTDAHGRVTEALEQQMATSDILRTIAEAQTDAQPVFDTIVESAARLCHAHAAAVFLTDGRIVYEPANFGGGSPEARAATRARFPRQLGMDSTAGIAILTRSVFHVPDTEDPSVIEHTRQSGRLHGFRSVVTVPMLREGEAVGAILVARPEPGRFSDAEVGLLKTFADQAVIAVENVRLFKELEARTAALTRSVEQLTALGEVGRAVSSTLDLETVLTTIVARAVELSGLDGGVVFEYDDGAEEFVQRAATETGGALAEVRRTTRIRKGEGVVGRTAITLEPVQVPDITEPAAYESRRRENLIASGIRAILAVPLVSEDRLIGCLGVTRNRPGEFPAETIELLRTFATQSALAIQNARLFHEIEDKSRQLEAASRHKSEFLANMSHELRTPLNAIIGFSEVLTERMFGELNEKQEEYLKDIYASGTHLLSLINDILDLSKIEAGRMELELTDFDLPQAIDNALILVRERAGRRGITLEHSVDERLGEIRGDERKVKQVLLNLLSNALKFTPEGGRVEVRAGMVDGMAEISVTDTGVGIAPEDQGAIFEEFRQVGTAEKKAEGTGLGLTLCRKFVELHGGRIWVKSQVGAGSTFSFTLPIRRGA